MLVTPSAANVWINLPTLSSITGGAGITISGGTQIDVQRLTSNAATAHAETTYADISSRGVPSGTYLYRFENLGNGTSTIIVHSYWEER